MRLKYLVIGAGPSGLAMAKSLKEAAIPDEHVEANTELGGNWFHGVYETVYTDASKAVMQYPDYPMPDSWPEFLSQPLMLKYLNGYAEHFGLRENIEFNKKVICIDALQNNLWRATFADGSSQVYRGVIVCNGHHWDPRHPELPGAFTGEYIHSKHYKRPEQLRNKRVLVVGSGNSAVDIACEAARVGSLAYMSWKDSPWIFPKSFMGRPVSRAKFRNAPKFMAPFLVRLLVRLSFGKHEDYGLPAPRHKPFEKHPTVSEELPSYLRHGRITVKPRIIAVKDKEVTFEDGSSQEFDIILGATGFKLSFPFLPEALVRADGQNLRCVGHVTYPDYKGLYFLGWQQVRGGIGSLTGAFSNVIVDMIRIEEEFELPAGQVLKGMGNRTSTSHLYGSREIFRWIRKHDYKAMSKKAARLKNGQAHENIPVVQTVSTDGGMRVY